MKKLVVLLSTTISLVAPKIAFALPTPSPLVVTPPPQGYQDLGVFITQAITLIFGFAILVVLVMLVWGAFEWITSGGDKEAVGKARNRIINALIGLAVLAVAYALTKVAADFVGINLLNIQIPGPP